MATLQLTYMDEVPPTEELGAIRIMNDVEVNFVALQEKLLELADGGDSGEATMRQLVDGGDDVIGEADDAYKYFSTVTRSTTTISIDLLAPMPMTGEWTGGKTMRISALVAQGLINDAQQLLPGYSLNTVIRDDKCEAETSVQIVLDEQASSDSYVA